MTTYNMSDKTTYLGAIEECRHFKCVFNEPRGTLPRAPPFSKLPVIYIILNIIIIISQYE